MRLITHPDRTVVKFSATELQSVGLPPRCAFVEYDAGLRLSTYSSFLGKSSWHEPGIDKLVAIADKEVGYAHRKIR